jgi:prevent-host-death family protein
MQKVGGAYPRQGELATGLPHIRADLTSKTSGLGSGDRQQIGDGIMAGTVRKSRMKKVPLSEVKDDLSHLLREAEKGDIVITRHGKPAGVLIGFASEDDWFEYRLENDPRFLRRAGQARKSLRTGRGVRLEDL